MHVIVCDVIQYARLEDARAAQQNLNGLELAGRPIKVILSSLKSVTYVVLMWRFVHVVSCASINMKPKLL